MKDGKPDGNGNFVTEKTSGDEWSYDGTWENGNFKGEGKSLKKPFSDFYSSIGSKSSSSFKLSTNATTFLDEHEDLFPASNVDAVLPFTDTTVTYGHLDKDINRYSNALIKVKGYVTDAKAYSVGAQNVTYLHIVTDDMDSFIMYYKGDLDDVLKGDTVTAYGLPLSTTSFSNVSGGTTRAIVVAPCLVLK